MAQTIFDKLRSFETEGQSLNRLIGEACGVGNALTAALERVCDAYGFDPSIDSSIWQEAFAAIASAYAADGDTPTNGARAA